MVWVWNPVMVLGLPAWPTTSTACHCVRGCGGKWKEGEMEEREGECKRLEKRKEEREIERERERERERDGGERYMYEFLFHRTVVQKTPYSIPTINLSISPPSQPMLL